MTDFDPSAPWVQWALWCSCIVVAVMSVGQAVKGLVKREAKAWARWRWAFRAPSLMLGLIGIFFGGTVMLSTGLQPSVFLAGVLGAAMGAMSPLLYDGGVAVLRRAVRSKVDALDGTQTTETDALPED